MYKRIAMRSLLAHEIYCSKTMPAFVLIACSFAAPTKSRANISSRDQKKNLRRPLSHSVSVEDLFVPNSYNSLYCTEQKHYVLKNISKHVL